MKTLILAAIRCSLMFTAVAALSIVYPTAVQAVPTTYSYTGNPFTFANGPYTTSMFVTAMVTLAAPLGANMPPLHDVTPTAFTLFDGVQTLTNTSPGLNLQLFSFATNARGEITFWNVAVENTATVHFIQTLQDGIRLIDVGGTRDFEGINFDSPGVWTQANATPDAGSTLSLMTLTLMALGLVARRFQRAAA